MIHWRSVLLGQVSAFLALSVIEPRTPKEFLLLAFLGLAAYMVATGIAQGVIETEL